MAIKLPLTFGYASMKEAFGKRWARFILGVIILLTCGALGAAIYFFVKQAGRSLVDISGQLTVNLGSLKPDKELPPSPTEDTETQLNTQLAARVQSGEPKWESEVGGTYLVRVKLHISTKFQRSGLLLNFKSNHIEDFIGLIPLNRQPTVDGQYKEEVGFYSHYVQRPWGQYEAVLRVKPEAKILFTYRFEGEKESKGVTWKIP